LEHDCASFFLRPSPPLGQFGVLNFDPGLHSSHMVLLGCSPEMFDLVDMLTSRDVSGLACTLGLRVHEFLESYDT
jgi:hypothetical protein